MGKINLNKEDKARLDPDLPVFVSKLKLSRYFVSRWLTKDNNTPPGWFTAHFIMSTKFSSLTVLNPLWKI